jgi:predicted RNA binding protein YcfA (HicA-like mRNA interferase family)
MKSADLIRELTKAGWILDRVRGSHHVFRHPSKPQIVVIPHPRKDLGKGLISKIRKQADI